MNRSERAALALGVTALGTTLIARTLRAARRLDLNGRTVVITGGSRGLGLVLARQMGLQGARVVVGARDQAELDRAWTDLQDRGIDATAVTCDVGVAEQAQQLIDTAVSKTGQLDVLINNAGIIQVGPIEHMTVEDFAQAMRVHFWVRCTPRSPRCLTCGAAEAAGSSTSRPLEERWACRISCRIAPASSR